jgi:hypothetical protein
MIKKEVYGVVTESGGVILFDDYKIDGGFLVTNTAYVDAFRSRNHKSFKLTFRVGETIRRYRKENRGALEIGKKLGDCVDYLIEETTGYLSTRVVTNVYTLDGLEHIIRITEDDLNLYKADIWVIDKNGEEYKELASDVDELLYEKLSKFVISYNEGHSEVNQPKKTFLGWFTRRFK